MGPNVLVVLQRSLQLMHVVAAVDNEPYNIVS